VHLILERGDDLLKCYFNQIFKKKLVQNEGLIESTCTSESQNSPKSTGVFNGVDLTHPLEYPQIHRLWTPPRTIKLATKLPIKGEALGSAAFASWFESCDTS